VFGAGLFFLAGNSIWETCLKTILHIFCNSEWWLWL